MHERNARIVGGRIPADRSLPRLRLRRAAGATITPPASVDWLSAVRSWPMLGNDTVGDCTTAGAGHVAQQVNLYGQGVDAPITEQDALAAYSAISGYDPRRPSTDVGATLQDAADYWRKVGIGGNKIAAWAEIDPQDLDLVRACIATFGTVYTGCTLPESALDQLDAGQPWTVVKRSAIAGGHCVPIGAYNADGFTCVTWGQLQPMNVAFYKRYFDEVIVPIDLDWMRAVGTSPGGLDTNALNADYEQLTGDPGPFPAVDVPPVVTPPPVNPPADDDTADQALADALGQMQAAVTTWKIAKGL
jgi:hypothetical protein